VSSNSHDLSAASSSFFVSALECRDIVLEAYIHHMCICTWYILLAMHMRPVKETENSITITIYICGT